MENKNRDFKEELAKKAKENEAMKNIEKTEEENKDMMKKIGKNARTALKIILDGDER